MKDKRHIKSFNDATENLSISDVMISLLTIGIENIKIGDKVRWFYQYNKYDKPTDEIVYIGGKPTGNEPSDRVRIDRIKNGKLVEGGFVRLDELYLTN